MNAPFFSVTFLGTRGSLPVCGREFEKFGGGSACVLVRVGGETIVLDAGSGLTGMFKTPAADEKKLSFLLSHPHLDHLLGLPICLTRLDDTVTVDFYAKRRQDLSPEMQVRLLMSPPLWPVGPEVFCAHLNWHEVKEEAFAIGKVKVTTMESNHPGGSTIYKLSFGGKDMVYATDCECTETFIPELAAFAKGCALLIIDAQYTAEEMPRLSGYGHSAWEDALEAGRRAKAAKIAFFHHDPGRTDEQLIRLQAAAREKMPEVFFAEEGKESRI